MNMIYLLTIICVLQKQIQSDWMGGSGIQGPVSQWGTRYYSGDSITAATQGQVSLVATSWDYSQWVKHSIEVNPGIIRCTQGLLPADIDKDGIEDVVAHTNDTVVWYKHDGNYGFTKNIIGPASVVGGKMTSCVFPCDLDKDGDIDVLVATSGIGVGWFKNSLPGAWGYNKIDSTHAYHRVTAADIDLDGNMDVIASIDSTSPFTGTIYIFKNGGSQNFSVAQSIVTWDGGWRVYTVDFNKDGYPDLYSVYLNTDIYLNDKTGHFNRSFYADLWGGSPDFDGAWPSDINMDGNMDLVCGSVNTTDYGFHAFLGDGLGNFTDSLLVSNMLPYTDGSMARDVDLDSLPDIVGTYTQVGWLRQTGNLTFAPYGIDSSLTKESHWVYATPFGNQCVPTIDLLVTQEGEHMAYENKIVKGFASPGNLTSSVLKLSDTLKSAMYFGWSACVPGDSTLAFWWRADSLASTIDTQAWWGPYYAIKDTDSVKIPLYYHCARYFQYKAEFWQQNMPAEIASLYEVWVGYDTCQPAGVEEAKTVQNFSLQVIGNRILLSPNKKLNNVELSIYNTAGELVQTVYKGPLDVKSYTFIPKLRTKGVYLVTLKHSGKTETVKMVKSR